MVFFFFFIIDITTLLVSIMTPKKDECYTIPELIFAFVAGFLAAFSWYVLNWLVTLLLCG